MTRALHTALKSAVKMDYKGGWFDLHYQLLFKTIHSNNQTKFGVRSLTWSINITIQSFKSENELELSLVKWDSVKD